MSLNLTSCDHADPRPNRELAQAFTALCDAIRHRTDDPAERERLVVKTTYKLFEAFCEPAILGRSE